MGELWLGQAAHLLFREAGANWGFQLCVQLGTKYHREGRRPSNRCSNRDQFSSKCALLFVAVVPFGFFLDKASLRSPDFAVTH